MSISKRINKKKIIVLGNGFISQAFLNYFNKDKKFSLICLSKPNENLKKITGVKYLNIRDHKNIKKIHKIDFIINALGNINHSNFKTKSESVIFNEHFNLPIKILKNLNLTNKIIFLQIGSIDEINQLRKNPYHLTPYALSKNFFSNYLLTLKYNHFIDVRIIYVNSVFGKNQKKNRFIPSVINSFVNKKSFTPTYPDENRNFISSTELVTAIHKILNKPYDFKEKIIIKSKNDYKIKDIVSYIYSQNKSKLKIRKYKSQNFKLPRLDYFFVKDNLEKKINEIIKSYINN